MYLLQGASFIYNYGSISKGKRAQSFFFHGGLTICGALGWSDCYTKVRYLLVNCVQERKGSIREIFFVKWSCVLGSVDNPRKKNRTNTGKNRNFFRSRAKKLFSLQKAELNRNEIFSRSGIVTGTERNETDFFLAPITWKVEQESTRLKVDWKFWNWVWFLNEWVPFFLEFNISVFRMQPAFSIKKFF